MIPLKMKRIEEDCSNEPKAYGGVQVTCFAYKKDLSMAFKTKMQPIKTFWMRNCSKKTFASIIRKRQLVKKCVIRIVMVNIANSRYFRNATHCIALN